MKIEIEETVDARKQRFDEAAAWSLLQGAAKVSVAKGKKVDTLVPASAGREALLKQAMGPSGNLRAPTLRVGEGFIVGFNEELYKSWFA